MKLLVTGAFGCDEDCIEQLESLGHTVLLMPDERGALPSNAQEVEGIVCNSIFLHHSVEAFPRLRFLQLTSAGLDRVPVKEFTERGVAVFNAKGVYAVPLAEWVVMQLLQIFKQARFFMRNQDERRWQKQGDLRELAGRTACIIGFGDVGREIAKRLKAFGVNVIAVGRQPGDSPLADRFVGIDSLHQVLPESDFVILAVPLNPDTTHLVGAVAIGRMKADAVLVNVSRGQVIDESALVGALESGRFLGVALDVFEEEPLPFSSRLWEFERVLITPHNSFVSDRVAERMRQLTLANLAAIDRADGGGE